MKKIIPLFVLCLLLIAAVPTPTQASWYSHGQGRKVVLLSQQWTSVGGFSQRLESIVTLNGTVFTSSVPDLLHISGVCVLKRAPNTVLIGRIMADGVWHEIGESVTNTLVVNYTLPAVSFTIDLYQDSTAGANGVGCNLLIEKVK